MNSAALHTRSARPSPGIRVLGGLAATACLLAGCARYSQQSLLSDVEGADAMFEPDRRERPVVSASGPPLAVTPVRIERVEIGLPSPGPLTVGAESVEAVAGTPAPPSEPGRPAGSPLLVDAKVGEINGLPIYANTFFEEVAGPGARLSAKAREKGITREAWLREAWDLIEARLQRIMEDELIEAEARASLKPPQRQGLRAFAAEWGERTRRGAGGSRTALERKLQQDYNQTYEQFLRDVESRYLVQRHLEDKVESRVFVTQRDMVRYYDLNKKEYLPDPKARFWLIRVPTRQTEDVRTVQDALHGGQPFTEVAKLPINTVQDSGLQERTFTGERKDVDLFGTETALNEAARTLGVGEWTRTPLTYGVWTAWLYLESIDQPRLLLTDEEVQMKIHETLLSKKRQDLANAYFTRLAEGASLGDVPAMRVRLMRIAVTRYWDKRSEDPASPE